MSANASPSGARAGQPRLNCDLILKGGITSGVVYPAAIHALSKAYTFVNVGGTSAGAIAAAVAAAAEYARAGGDTAAFERVAALPAWFAAETSSRTSNLLGLFQPDPRMERLFRILRFGLNRANGGTRAAALASAALRQFWPAALAGALPGLATVAAGIALLRAGGGFPSQALALVAGVGGGLLAAAGALAVTLLRISFLLKELPACGFGLCPGVGTDPGRPALSEWLHREIGEIAGKPVDAPLTFGDLRERGIHLTVLTTNLAFGRPEAIPFPDHTYAFSKEELCRVLPERVVDFMITRARISGDPDLRAALERQGLHLLPKEEDLPVVFAVRLSLSFPFLVSAVPLWAFDFSRAFNGRDAAGRRPLARAERCWFSDGGIGSNFPVHFFDSPIPRWPTFAFDLGPFHPDHPEDREHEERNVFRPRTNGDGLSEEWNRFADEPRPLTRLARLGLSIVDTMQNWRDNSLLRVPGFRDRIVHVFLAPDEGGLNLDMKREVLERLARRGRAAGELLVEAFAKGAVSEGLSVSAWDNHRWVRLRTALNLLESWHGKFTTTYAAAGYDALLSGWRAENPYPFARDQREPARAGIAAFISVWSVRSPGDRGLFGGSVPRPVPFLRVVPPIAMPPD